MFSKISKTIHHQLRHVFSRFCTSFWRFISVKIQQFLYAQQQVSCRVLHIIISPGFFLSYASFLPNSSLEFLSFHLSARCFPVMLLTYVSLSFLSIARLFHVIFLTQVYLSFHYMQVTSPARLFPTIL